MKQIKKYFPIFYIAFIFFVFLYIKDTLKEEKITVQVAEEKKEAREIKPIDVTLQVTDGKYFVEYKAKMENVNTVDDFLEYLRDHNNFYFEKTEYIYGTEYENINNINTPKGYNWHFYANDQEITHQTSGRELIDNAVYKLSLEKIEN